MAYRVGVRSFAQRLFHFFSSISFFFSGRIWNRARMREGLGLSTQRSVQLVWLVMVHAVSGQGPLWDHSGSTHIACRVQELVLLGWHSLRGVFWSRTWIWTSGEIVSVDGFSGCTSFEHSSICARTTAAVRAEFAHSVEIRGFLNPPGLANLISCFGDFCS